MDKKSLNKKQIISICISAALVVFGVLFCVSTNKIYSAIETAICLAAIAYGGFYVFVYCLLDNGEKNSWAMVIGILSLGVGLLIIIVPSFFLIASGLVIALYHFATIIKEIKAKKAGRVMSKCLLISAAIFMGLGLVQFVLAIVKISHSATVIIFGGLLIAIGAYNIAVTLIKYKQNIVKNLKSETDKPVAEDNAS